MSLGTLWRRARRPLTRLLAHLDLRIMVRKPSTSTRVAGETPAEEQPISSAKISSDRPVRSMAEDSYGLSNSVVPRLFRAAVDWPAGEGLILGLYGPWGIGKSSVLYMLEDYVRRHEEERPGVLTVRFNPWFYDDQAALITSFFGTVAAKLGTQEDENWEQIGSALKKMGSFLSAASSGISLMGVKVDFAAIAETLRTAGEAASALDRGEQELEETRARLEQVLRQVATSKARLVIMVDDVDRLTRPELLGLFRLLRVVGDLPAVTIIVAMDDVRVHQLLSTPDDPHFGKSFTEKIIQAGVPVPYPPREAISTRVAKGLEVVLTEADFGVPDDLRLPEWEIDKRRPITLLTNLIQTPRDLARYFNSLRLFLLAGAEPADVHPTDAVLIEVLRVFYPDVYMRVQRNRDFFVDKIFRGFEDRTGRREENEARRREQLHSIISDGSGMAAADYETVEAILNRLFGDVKETTTSVDVRRELSDHRRIASPDFFANYFSLHPVEGLITKREMNEFLTAVVTAAEAGNHEQVAEVVRTAVAGRPRQQISQMASESQARLSQIPIDVVTVAAMGVVKAVSEQEDVVYVALIASFVEAIKAQLSIYEREEQNGEAARAMAVEVLELAVRELKLPNAATLVEHVLAVRWLNEEEKANVAAAWIRRFAEEEDNHLFWEASAEDTATIWRAAHRAAGRAGDDEPALSRSLRDRLCRSVAAEPSRLPTMLYQVSVQSGDGVYLKSQMRSDAELVERLENIIGIECLRKILIDSIDNEADPHGLVPQLRGLLSELDRSLPNGDRTNGDDNGESGGQQA